MGVKRLRQRIAKRLVAKAALAIREIGEAERMRKAAPVVKKREEARAIEKVEGTEEVVLAKRRSG